MMRGKFGIAATALVACCGLALMCRADAFAQGRAESDERISTPAAGISPSPPPDVRSPGPGVFVQQKRGPDRFHLVLTGRQFTSREAIENYLAWRAAELTAQQGFAWFTFAEHRGKADTVPAPRRDPDGMRYSFRMAFFRPVWRYQLAAAPAAWKSWSPFSGKPFWADGLDARSVARFQVSADIVLHKGQVEDDNPLAFDADAVSDYLINQVQPPE
jgi:hypothetical protein